MIDHEYQRPTTEAAGRSKVAEVASPSRTVLLDDEELDGAAGGRNAGEEIPS